MPDNAVSSLSPPSSEDQRIAAGHFEYAHRAAVGGNHDMAIRMLRISCRLVPGNLAYRQALRKAEKTKYKDNRRGSFLAPLTSSLSRFRLWRASKNENHLRVLDLGEALLARNPWDKTAHLLMAQAAAALQMPAVAIWLLHEIRQVNTTDAQVNRALARLLEHQGYFTQAMHLWELVRRKIPTDAEAQSKAKQMAVSETIARGGYEEILGIEGAAGQAEKNPGDGTGDKMPRLATGSSDKMARVQAAPSGDKTGDRLQALSGEANKPRAGKDRLNQEGSLRARLATEPGNVDVYLQLANLLRRQGQPEETRAILRQGLEATNQAFELTAALADLEIEPLRRALEETEEQIRTQPGDDKLARTREKILKKINTHELALYRQKADRDSGDRGHRLQLGIRLFRAGQVEEAITELQTARSDGRLQWQAQLYLGHCFKVRGNWPLARRNYDEALKGIPASEANQRKDLLFEMAQGYAEASDLERAVELALDLADLDYGYRGIGQLLEQWQGQVQKASAARRS